MSNNELVKSLVCLFKTARHLWGRCPECDALFRLSDVAISSSPNPPREWLLRLQRQQAALLDKEDEVAGREDELRNGERSLSDEEREVRRRELRLERYHPSGYAKSSAARPNIGR